MVTAAKLKLCDESMARVRQTLSLPDPEQELWRSLTENQRIVLLMAAGLPAVLDQDNWYLFSKEQRVLVFSQIQTFGRIAQQFHSIRRGRGEST